MKVAFVFALLDTYVAMVNNLYNVVGDADGGTSNPTNISKEMRDNATEGGGIQDTVDDDGTPTETEGDQEGLNPGNCRGT